MNRQGNNCARPEKSVGGFFQNYHLDKADQMPICKPTSEASQSQGAGAPDQNAIQRVDVLRGRPSHLSQPTPPASAGGPMVDVQVGARLVQLPEHALHAGSAHLRLATGERVGFEDYAASVGAVLTALERATGLEIFQCEMHTPDAWQRFERAVDVVAKSPPQHRKAKTKKTKRKSAKKPA